MNRPWAYEVLWKLELLVGRGVSSNGLVRAVSTALYRLRFRLFPRDFLTGFLRRPAFQRRVEASLAAEKSGALLVVDVDRFKSVNDRWGQEVGDECLQHLSAMIRESTTGRTVGRLGGDEFVVYTDLASEAAALAERIRGRVRRDQRFTSMRAALASSEHEQAAPVLTVSIGIAYARTSRPYSELLQEADMALCEAKDTGRDKVVSSGHRKT